MITLHRNETLNGPPLNTGRHSHAAAIYNGSIVICGGTEIDGYRLSSCERLQGSDLWTGAWQTFAALPIEVDNGCLMTISNVVCVSKRKPFQMSLFQLYHCGGAIGPNGEPTSAVYKYNPTSGQWQSAPSLPVAIANHACVGHNRQGFVCGGSSDRLSLVRNSVRMGDKNA